MDTSNKDGFSVHCKKILINDIYQIIALISKAIGNTKSKLFQNLVKTSWDSVRLTRPTISSYIAVNLEVLIL